MPELDNDGLWEDDPGAMTTYSRQRVNPLTMSKDLVRIEDIAGALAHQCRYAGHTAGHLSVARHSIWVALQLPRYLRLSGLLHDAAEAYLGDLVRPLKHTQFGEAYLEAEARLEQIIFDHFGLAYPLHPDIAEADRRVLLDMELADDTPARWHWNSSPTDDYTQFMHLFDLYGSIRIIGLAGARRSGKSEAGKVLLAHGYEEVHVGGEIAAELEELNPVVSGYDGHQQHLKVWLEEANRDLEWLKDHTNLRDQQIEHGMLRRSEDPDYWLKKTMDRLRPGGRYVFTSVRFPNEADAIRQAGGEVWRITRVGQERIDDPTERALDEYPHFAREIANAGTDLEGYHRLISDALNQTQDRLEKVR